MRALTKLNFGLFLGTLIAFGAGGMLAVAKKGDDSADRGARRARAVVYAPGVDGGPLIQVGVVTFKQEPCPGCPVPDPSSPRDFRNFPAPTVTVDAKIRGIKPGAHGFHIHEHAACEPSFAAAGAHFDPSHPGDVNNTDHPFHMGELDNLVADRKGRAHLRDETNRVTLSPGELSLFDPPPATGGPGGSAVIVHRDPDMGTRGKAGGPRIACGVIEPEK